MVYLEYSREKRTYKISKKWVHQHIETMIRHFPKDAKIPLLDKFEKKKQYSISVAIVGEKTIQRLNCDFRGKDSVTDVLSIERDPDEFILPSFRNVDLGEVILCYPQIVRQAKEHGMSIRQETQKLLIHGFLHALGYDHVVSKDWKVMEPLEKRMKDILDQERTT